MSAATRRARHLNQNCDCAGTDLAHLNRAIAARVAAVDPGTRLTDTHPHLFSEMAVFMSRDELRAIETLIEAIEWVVSRREFAEQALAAAPPIARAPQPTRGAMLAYDFHITDDGPRLIEINTNAGGALLNVELQRAQFACCGPAAGAAILASGPAAIEDAITRQFLEEWRRARADAPPPSIAIVDDDPTRQYLYPEFVLFERLFRRAGLEAHIVDARALHWREGGLWSGAQRIDLVYNRLTDFYFEDLAHAALRCAYESGAAIVTPHPRAHALYAHKKNLVILSDESWLRAAGATDETVTTLTRGIPRTRLVCGDVGRWWRERSRWFFKPACGFGSRAAYRGDKLTRRVFDQILRGNYVAQEIAAAGERRRGPQAGGYKFDLRVYRGERQPLLLAARLYQGQTTNFRTPGGGFAPVVVVDEAAGAGAAC